MLVLAGAGSGKTRVVTFRIRELIDSGTSADRILAVTFTNKAAREMRERTTKLLKAKRGAPKPEVSTLHSLCVRILRRHAERLGYPKQFSICDQGDQESLARGALRRAKVEQQKLKPSEFLSIVGGWKSKGVNAEDALTTATDDKEQLAALAYGGYQSALLAQGAMDFDDLLIQAESLFQQFPDVRHLEASRFDQLMIDEYQDTNASQYRIIKSLAKEHRNLCVVGDDDQSIYGWRGAEVQHILNFKNDWPEAKIIRLEMNYRSREPILALANTLISNNTTRHPKTLKPFRRGGYTPRFLRFDDEAAEATGVVREIHQHSTREDEERIPLNRFAILFRTNEQPRAFELELRRANVPYVLVGGQSFFDRKEVRDLLAYVKVLANPADEVSLLRIFNTPSRGIGATTIKSLVGYALQQGAPLWEVMTEAIAEADLTPAIRDRLVAFQRFIVRYRSRTEDEPLSEVVESLIGEIDYRKELERLYKTPTEVEARFSAVEGVVASISEYENRTDKPTVQGFLEDTALGGRDDFGDDKESKQMAVTLMTFHSAKGLEYPHVYMVGMEEGILPHRRVIAEGNGVAEERRLCYVGVTRAMDTLTLSACKARSKWGKSKPSVPSRFLMEMRGENDNAAKAAAAGAAAVAEQLQVVSKMKEAREAAKKPATKRAKSTPATSARASASTRTAARSATSAVAQTSRPAVPSASRPVPRRTTSAGTATKRSATRTSTSTESTSRPRTSAASVPRAGSTASPSASSRKTERTSIAGSGHSASPSSSAEPGVVRRVRRVRRPGL